MKKNVILVKHKKIFILLSLLIVTVLIIYFLLFNTTYINFVRVNDNAVDNSYSNTLANEHHKMWSNLARIDDKLYYNYAYNDPFKYGTYEISNNFTKRIYWEGITVTPSLLKLNVIGDGKILRNNRDGSVDQYDIQESKFKPYIKLDDDSIKGKTYLCIFYINGKQYWYSGEAPMGVINKYKIYTCENNKLNLYFSTDEIGEGDFSVPAFVDDYIYLEAINDDSNDGKNYLYKYNTKTNTIVDQVEIDETSGGYNIVSKDKAYSIVYRDYDNENDRLIVTDIKNKTQKEIFDTDGSAIVNGYDDLVCIGVYSDSDSDKNGLYIIDEKTDKIKQIYRDQEVFGVYVVDDKWIYFSDETDKLYRITPDGKVIEKVFG